jgi:signal transduction histidine kinase
VDWTKPSRKLGKAANLGVVAAAAVLTIVTTQAPGSGLTLYPQMSTGLSLMSAAGRILGLPTVASADALVCSLLACALLWWRRQYPVPVCVGVLALCAVSPAGAAAAVALFCVAALCPASTTVWTGGLALLLVPAFYLLHPWGTSANPSTAVIGSMMVAGSIGWGLFLRSLHERTLRSEEEAALRAEQAQQRAREKIAREMHDVLAHRLSLLSVHAGALEFNPGAPAREVHQAAAVIRQSAHQALEDLQEVLAVLRTAPRDTDTAEPPQPTVSELNRLVKESQAAGMRIEMEQHIRALDAMTPTTGRTAYRIVQEALTNARKHAADAPVHLTLRGAPGDGLTVEITNPAPPGPAATKLPGSGYGLPGLAERAALAGGRLEYGRVADMHRVSAWLPWPA